MKLAETPLFDTSEIEQFMAAVKRELKKKPPCYHQRFSHVLIWPSKIPCQRCTAGLKKEGEKNQPPKARLLTCPSTFSDETASSGCWSTKANTAVCVTFDQSGVECLHAGTANPYSLLAVTPYSLLQIRLVFPHWSWLSKDLDGYVTQNWGLCSHSGVKSSDLSLKECPSALG